MPHHHQPNSSAVDSSPSSWLPLHRFRQQKSHHKNNKDGINSYYGDHYRNCKTAPKRPSSDGEILTNHASKITDSGGNVDTMSGGSASSAEDISNGAAKSPISGTRSSLNDLCKNLRKMGRRGSGGSLLRRSVTRAASIASGGNNNKKVADDTDEPNVDGGARNNDDPESSSAMGLSGSTCDFHSMYEIVSPLIGEGSTCRVMEVKRKTKSLKLLPYHSGNDDDGDCGIDDVSTATTKGKDIETSYACKVMKIATTNHDTSQSSSGSTRKDTQETTREMVTMELQVMKSLGAHPSILALHDVIWSGTADQCACYLVTELARGGTLADVLKERGRLQEHVARAVMSQVLGAVGFMHSNGLAHRDLKPHNIFLMRPNEFGPGNIKVADFGLSKFLASNSTKSTFDDCGDVKSKCDSGERHTICGSPLYVAPEMLMVAPGTDGTGKNGKNLAQPRAVRAQDR